MRIGRTTERKRIQETTKITGGTKMRIGRTTEWSRIEVTTKRTERTKKSIGETIQIKGGTIKRKRRTKRAKENNKRMGVIAKRKRIGRTKIRKRTEWTPKRQIIGGIRK